MATATSRETTRAEGQDRTDADSGRILLDGVSWDTYESLLKDFERSGSNVRMTYDRGSLELMSPSEPHEHAKHILGRLVVALTEELNIPIRAAGSTTFRRQLKAKGLEPDESFWVARLPLIRGRRKLDLAVDPVPDLAIEVEVSRSALDRLALYASLGFAEVWRYDGERLHVVGLNADGTYLERPRSEIFPFLPIESLLPYLRIDVVDDDNAPIRAFREWVRAELVPRHGRPEGG